MNIFLIVTAVVVSVLILGTAVVMLVKFLHPDDKFQAWFPKIVIILSLYLIMATAMIMPFDVANADAKELDTDLLWYISLIAVAVFSIILVPFSYFYYESMMDNDDLADGTERTCCQRQFWTAFWYTFAFLMIVAVLSIVLYATPANLAHVPTHRIAQHVSNMVPMCTGTPGSSVFQPFHNVDLGQCATQGLGCSALGNEFTWEFSVSFPVYLLALLSFLGWFFMFIFAGVGLVALPMELINEYRTRPNPISRKVFDNSAAEISTRAGALIEECLLLRDGTNGAISMQAVESKRKRRKFGNVVRDMEQKYYDLRHDWDLLKISRDYSNSNPLWYILKLVLGIIAVVLSVCWIIHIAIFMLPPEPIDPFLNSFFIILTDIASGNFPLFGVLAYSIFVFYLLWCILMGNYKFGVRLLIFKVYPLEINNTYTSAFLANIWILLQCVFPLVQFIATAFPIYARDTAIEALYGSQIKYLNFFKYFWQYNIFVILLLAMAVLTLPVMICCPNSRKKKLQAAAEQKASSMRKHRY